MEEASDRVDARDSLAAAAEPGASGHGRPPEVGTTSGDVGRVRQREGAVGIGRENLAR